MWNSFKKALEWRGIAMAVDFAIAYTWTRRISLSLGIVSIAGVFKIIIFTLWHKKRK